ncbi:hypothetical protein RDWZM_005496 [Blomia tropicalis]|uniref:Uncharacterized protein n=1 Tax=Blomia tropicalis TaxID=40697 RepID=A0A9Q0RME1_BLOTA|nr:hypothetical protein RDWZM_005496 [Blomia tropicalis]
MNDILQQSNGIVIKHPLHQFGSVLNTNEPVFPVARSYSDASEFANRSNPIGRQFGSYVSNVEHNRMEQFMNRNEMSANVTPRPMSSNLFASSTTTTTTSADSGESQSNLFKSTGVANNQTSTQDDEDNDLNIVFDEIGALQNKGLDETEDDVSLAPLTLPQIHPQQHNNVNVTSSPAISKITQQQQQQQQQTVPQPQTASVQTSDGKVITYNPQVYDETDITLANEKYSHNIR